jgi:hypothetical protein
MVLNGAGPKLNLPAIRFMRGIRRTNYEHSEGGGILDFSGRVAFPCVTIKTALGGRWSEIPKMVAWSEKPRNLKNG